MSYALTVLEQVMIMLLLAGVGAFLYSIGKISLEGSNTIGNILLNVSLPAVIFRSFLVDCTPQRTLGLLIGTAFSLLSLLLAIGISRLFLKKDAVGQFAASFSNPGFFGIPIVTACLGDKSVAYIAPYIALLNLLQWSYGVRLLTNSRATFPWKKFLKAPFLIAMLLGLFFYFTGIALPSVAATCVSLLAGLNTPLSMFVVGIYLVQIDWKQCIHRITHLKIAAVKLLIVPLATLLTMLLLPEKLADVKFALLIAAACPTGSNLVVYAKLHDCDAQYAAETVIVTTLLSILTIPLFVKLVF